MKGWSKMAKNVIVKMMKNGEPVDAQLTPEQIKQLENMIKAAEGIDVKVTEPPKANVAITTDDDERLNNLTVPSVSEVPARENVVADAAEVYKTYLLNIDNMYVKNETFHHATEFFEREYGEVFHDNHCAPAAFIEDYNKLAINPSGTLMSAVVPAMNNAVQMVDAAKFVNTENSDSAVAIASIHAKNFEISADHILSNMINDVSLLFSKLIAKFTLDKEKLDSIKYFKNRFGNEDEDPSAIEIARTCEYFGPVSRMPGIIELKQLKSYHPIQDENGNWNWMVSGDTIAFYATAIYNYLTSSFFAGFKERVHLTTGSEDKFARMMTDFECNYSDELKRFITATLLEIARIASIHLINIGSVKVYPTKEEDYGKKSPILTPPPYGFIDC